MQCLGKDYHIVQRGDWGGGRFSVKGSNPQVVLSGTEGEASGAGRGWGEGGDSSSWPGSQGADNRLVLISPNSYPPTC